LQHRRDRPFIHGIEAIRRPARLAVAIDNGGADALVEIASLQQPAGDAVFIRQTGFEIVAGARARASEVDLLLLEGAGGLLVPVSGRTTFADLAAELGARLVVVVGARLGAINHAMLTIEAARARGLEVAAVVVNHAFDVRDLATETLAATLASLGACSRIAEAPHGTPPDGALAAVAREIAAARS